MNTTEVKIKEMEERLAVMKAFQEGKQVEFCFLFGPLKGPWHNAASTLSWDWSQHNYRVKRIPREVIFVGSDNIGKFACMAYPEEAKEGILRNNPGRKLVTFREVLED